MKALTYNPKEQKIFEYTFQYPKSMANEVESLFEKLNELGLVDVYVSPEDMGNGYQWNFDVVNYDEKTQENIHTNLKMLYIVYLVDKEQLKQDYASIGDFLTQSDHESP